ncbi:circularly permuted type 2 ATP-grasp protein [Desulfogranum japonicum]|uniref:circularly permuted type 2 ATP-grasp protein n=1 Tax=Desulfogranum japonicum TaxID=231447 RepID=UPI00048D8595|nr:circularly permuted type 2 ATP-grasp protein [Desulfogranum japonicum]
MTRSKMHSKSAASHEQAALFSSFSVSENSYCESHISSSEARGHWQVLINSLSCKDSDTLSRYHDRAMRMRQEDGAVINPFDELDKQPNSWSLDILPVLLTSKEWEDIELGIVQRARLLENLLADVYGVQETAKKRLLPAEMVFANPHFLHSCHGIQPLGGRFLTFYGVDMYRDVNGTFKVFRDYTDLPTGLGYALENRIVLSRLFADFYPKKNIQRLAPFFKTFHQALIERLSLSKNDPGICLLTSGPGNPLYFEQVLLSRYLGYPLVEGQDLTVRDAQLFLKKLGGLERVEALFRHISDRESDSFALHNSADTGVAGLIQVCREQNIEVINPLGSGFAQSPGLAAFLPDLCRHLLGQELKLANHPSYWCGDKYGLEYALAHPDHVSDLAPHQFFEEGKAVSVSGDQLSRHPRHFFASPEISPSTAPVWKGDSSASQYILYRFYACATADGFAVLPGGLALTAESLESLVGNNPAEQSSKDIWVFSDKVVEPVSLMQGMQTIPEFKRHSDLPSRVADNLLWLGRYLERAEGMIRLLRTVYRRVSGEDRFEDIPELPFLVVLLKQKGILPESPEEDTNQLLSFDLFDYLYQAVRGESGADTIINILKRVLQTAWNVRNRFSLDSLKMVNMLDRLVRRESNDPLEDLDMIMLTLSGFSGLAMESMTRGLGWRFMDLGRRIERAVNQVSLIHSSLTHICIDSETSLPTMLEVSDSLMTYRDRYRTSFQLGPVLDLLLADETNPKSVGFQLKQIASHVKYLPQHNERRFATPEERLALEMLTGIRLLDLSLASCSSDMSEEDELSVFLQSLEEKLGLFSQHVTSHYLSRIPTTPHYGTIHGSLQV